LNRGLIKIKIFILPAFINRKIRRIVPMKILKFALTAVVFLMVVFMIISGCATKSETVKSEAVIEEPEQAPEESVMEKAVEEEEKPAEEKVEAPVVEEEPDIKIVNKIEEGKKTTTYSYSVEFDSDSANIRVDYYQNVQEALDFMDANPDAEIIKIIIEGRADSTGSVSHNYALAERRLNSVKQVLVERLNVDPAIIETHNYGERKPIASNKTKAGRQRNRSAVVTILISF
jgi:outer membrane protein OmpA-like peptidoglycan-associated protein